MYICVCIYAISPAPLLVVQLVECMLGHMSPAEVRVFLPIWSLVAHPPNFASAQKIINATEFCTGFFYVLIYDGVCFG